MRKRNGYSATLYCLLGLSCAVPSLSSAQSCIVLDCPGTVRLCAGPEGANAFFDVTATDTCGTNVVVICEPPSGSLFPAGTNLVTCVATNELGDRAVCTFPVIVGDSEPPVLIFPARALVPCISPDGAPVHYSVAVEDNCDTNVTLVCDPPSGTVFPPGTNEVVCLATDASGNQARATFSIIVAGGCGTDPCVRFAVSDMTVPCTGPGGAVVEFKATATNTCEGTEIPIEFTPPSGTLLPVGLHQVVCKAGSTAAPSYAAFIVEVIDEEPPAIQCPSDIVVPAQNALGAVVFFQATGMDDCSTNVVVRCSPPSGGVFPVGKTRVTCEGTDGHGNTALCSFEVEVTAPPPLRAQMLGEDKLELRWTGEAMVETADRLGPQAEWQLQTGTIEMDGMERLMRLEVADDQKFFRINPMPLLPPPDEDGDGVPDMEDRCPGTPLRSGVDQYGCVSLDVVTVPEGIFEPERAQVHEVLRQLAIDGGFPEAIGLLLPAVQKVRAPAAALNERDIPGAFFAQSDFVTIVRNALLEFQRRKPARMAEILASAPRLEAEHADFRQQDFELMRLDDIEALLQESLEGSLNHWQTVSNLHAAVTGVAGRGRARVESVDEARGVARLSDGQLLLLPRPGSPGAPLFSQIPVVLAPGSLIDFTFYALPGGVLLGESTSPVAPTVDDIVYEIDPRCLRVRFVPAEVNLSLWDSGKRHKPFGYFWGASFDSSRYYLEHGMGLAVVKVSCPYEAPGAYRHWVKILHDSNNNGTFSTLADYIDQSSPPVTLRASDFPDSATPFPIIVREFRAPVLEGGNLGPAAVVGEETLMVVVRKWGHYADAVYTRTIFELEDRPSSTEWQAAAVDSLTRRYPLTLKPANEHQFLAAGYKVSGNSTTYPNTTTVGQDELFSVHLKDPNEDLFFAATNDLGRGLYYPMVRGHRNGLPHQYRVTLPALVRDRIVNCAGTDTYYRIPFDPVVIVANIWIGGTYSVSQGNNGTFTHTGWQAFAWDFPKSAGTPVRAARGGRVLNTRNTSTLSCWNATAQACQNCTGAASPNFVTIQHQDGTVGWYLHFQVGSVLVTPGQRVYRGDPIASVGTTGCSTGNHLHLDVRDGSGNTVPAGFQAYDGTQTLRQCFNPPAQSNGWSNNEPFDWPF